MLGELTRWFQAAERWGTSLARRKRVAVAVCGLLALGIRALEAPRMPVPVPHIRDEFSYLLAADTFASGRLTNDAHPMWQHFESFHILQLPTYMSMYPPAQGLFMAAGQKLTGLPWIGIWLSLGIFCATACWMLQGWLPPGWAFLGGLMIVMRLGVFTYWMNTYWGGAVAGIGGMLMFGALPRILRKPSMRDALLLGLGVAILANSRPFEGMIAALPVAAALVVWLLRRGPGPRMPKLLRVAAPLTLVILATVAGMAYYNWRVTGNALEMPQQLNRRTYAVAPYFIWESPHPEPSYHHDIMRRFYTEWEGGYQSVNRQDTLDGWLTSFYERFFPVWGFYLGTLLTLPLLLLWWAIRDRRMRFWAWAVPFFAVGILLERFTQIHYVAPFAGCIYVLLLQSMRHLRQLRWSGQAAGLFCVRAVVVYCVAGFALRAVNAEQGFDYHWQFDRAQLEERLEKMPGQQLVVVRYSQDHRLDEEWVYNRADIDHSKVVWAREMAEPAENQRLLTYFRERKWWLLQPDVSQSELTPYLPW